VRYDARLRLKIERPWRGHKETVLKIAQETSSLRECRRIIQSGRNILYQLEVKRWLVAHSFPVAEGWTVTVDIDSMERGVVGQHPPEKKAVASECEKWLRNHGVKIDAHPVYGRADLVASTGITIAANSNRHHPKTSATLYASCGCRQRVVVNRTAVALTAVALYVKAMFYRHY
jgi:hypothetical protein